MELYIEKEFLDNFYIEVDQNNLSSEQKILISILTEYGDKSVFMDYEVTKLEDLEQLKNENEYFALLCNVDKPPIEINSIEEHLFNFSDFKQTIVFMNEKKHWFTKAEKEGALCFCFEDYKSEISRIVNQFHFRLDLNEAFEGWGFLEIFKNLEFNQIRISDGYILSDKDRQKIDDNIIPILKNIISSKNENRIKIEILTKELNPISEQEKYVKEKSKKIYNKLNSTFAQFNSKFRIIMNNIHNEFDFHDRNISTNFSIIDCGKGFNLIPFVPSDSQIISETIFDKYTYKRLRNINRNYNNYIEKLKKIETIKFKMFPE